MVPTAVHIIGEGAEQNLFAGLRGPPNCLFVLGIEQEYLRKMCRMSQTWTNVVVKVLQYLTLSGPNYPRPTHLIYYTYKISLKLRRTMTQSICLSRHSKIVTEGLWMRLLQSSILPLAN
jgi:hypothetical protein